MNTLVVATGNKGKLKEISHALSHCSLDIHAQNIYHVPPVEETGVTFVENALIKARHASHYCDVPVLADDSGLIVPALGGQPGVYSARYAGKSSSDQANCAKLLDAMQALSGQDRRAYFVCVMVIVRSVKDPYPIIVQASWEGSILLQPKGESGFGYDPIFQPAEFPGRSAAELSIAEKQSVSHRGKTMALLIDALVNL